MKTIKTENSYIHRRNIILVIIMLFFLTVITACSGGSSTSLSSGDVNNSGNSSALTGIFLDSPVEGLHYQTVTMSGFTDENGTFMYHQGESVSFMIGNYQLGSAPGSHIITPIDLVPGALDEMHPTVTNMVRLLQSLDQDGNLENGITITELMHAEMTDRMIDMHKGVNEFEDYDMEALFASLNMLGAFHGNGYRELRTSLEAQEHFRQTLMGDMHPDDTLFGQGHAGDDTGGMPQVNNNGSGLNQRDDQLPMHDETGGRGNGNDQHMMN
jgi:hypothetical protein